MKKILKELKEIYIISSAIFYKYMLYWIYLDFLKTYCTIVDEIKHINNPVNIIQKILETVKILNW